MLKRYGMKAAIFFERDGVLNEAKIDGRHQRVPLLFEDFKVITSAIPDLIKLKEAGFLLIATTNQPAIAGGTLCRREVDLMHKLLERAFPLDDIFMCPHSEEDNCRCHKPESGMFTEAAFKWHLDMDRSFVISDKWSDAAAAHMAGCTSVLLKSPLSDTGHHDFVVKDLDAAVTKILDLFVPCESKLLEAV
jgi:D-glycero-D-manno-heptose 1,7-bisphosphate phosphatase